MKIYIFNKIKKIKKVKKTVYIYSKVCYNISINKKKINKNLGGSIL